MRLTYLCILSLSTQLLLAQNFTEVLGTPFEGVEVGSIAFSDVDGDGDQDVFITGSNSSLSPIAKLYANDGTGTFSEFITSETSFVEAELSSIAFSDVDGDNHPDILIAGQVNSLGSATNLYINSGGTGAFDHVPAPFEGVSDCSIAFSDVDGDNDHDVLITGLNSSGTQTAKLYTNDGTGTFTKVAGTPFEGVAIGSIAFSDVDGDNDPDVLITGANSATTPIAKLYTNDGAGTFSEVTGTIFEGVFASSIAFSDVDGDNDQDVLITGQNSSAIPIAKLYTNDGMGTFSEVAGTPFEGIASGSIAFSDVDGDNDQDVLITGQNSSGTQIAKLYTNDGLVESIDSPIRTSNIPFRVYPNPIQKNLVKISINMEQRSRVGINLFDVVGRPIHQQEEQLIFGENIVLMDISAFEKGTYFISIVQAKKIGIQKLFIQ